MPDLNFDELLDEYAPIVPDPIVGQPQGFDFDALLDQFGNAPEQSPARPAADVSLQPQGAVAGRPAGTAPTLSYDIPGVGRLQVPATPAVGLSPAIEPAPYDLTALTPERGIAFQPTPARGVATTRQSGTLAPEEIPPSSTPSVKQRIRTTLERIDTTDDYAQANRDYKSIKQAFDYSTKKAKDLNDQFAQYHADRAKQLEPQLKEYETRRDILLAKIPESRIDELARTGKLEKGVLTSLRAGQALMHKQQSLALQFGQDMKRSQKLYDEIKTLQKALGEVAPETGLGRAFHSALQSVPPMAESIAAGYATGFAGGWGSRAYWMISGKGTVVNALLDKVGKPLSKLTPEEVKRINLIGNVGGTIYGMIEFASNAIPNTKFFGPEIASGLGKKAIQNRALQRIIAKLTKNPALVNKILEKGSIYGMTVIFETLEESFQEITETFSKLAYDVGTPQQASVDKWAEESHDAFVRGLESAGSVAMLIAGGQIAGAGLERIAGEPPPPVRPSGVTPPRTSPPPMPPPIVPPITPSGLKPPIRRPPTAAPKPAEPAPTPVPGPVEAPKAVPPTPSPVAKPIDSYVAGGLTLKQVADAVPDEELPAAVEYAKQQAADPETKPEEAKYYNRVANALESRIDRTQPAQPDRAQGVGEVIEADQERRSAKLQKSIEDVETSESTVTEHAYGDDVELPNGAKAQVRIAGETDVIIATVVSPKRGSGIIRKALEQAVAFARRTGRTHVAMNIVTKSSKNGFQKVLGRAKYGRNRFSIDEVETALQNTSMEAQAQPRVLPAEAPPVEPAAPLPVEKVAPAPVKPKTDRIAEIEAEQKTGPKALDEGLGEQAATAEEVAGATTVRIGLTPVQRAVAHAESLELDTGPGDIEDPNNRGHVTERAAWAEEQLADITSGIKPDDVIRIQWKRNAEGLQTQGNHEVILPLTDALWDKYGTGKGARGPELTHIQLVKTDDAKDWKVTKIGSFDDVIADSVNHPEWSMRVNKFDDPDAVAWGRTADNPDLMTKRQLMQAKGTRAQREAETDITLTPEGRQAGMKTPAPVKPTTKPVEGKVISLTPYKGKRGEGGYQWVAVDRYGKQKSGVMPTEREAKRDGEEWANRKDYQASEDVLRFVEEHTKKPSEPSPVAQPAPVEAKGAVVPPAEPVREQAGGNIPGQVTAPLSLEEQLQRGEKVKPPKGATFVRVTDKRDRTAVLSVKSLGTAKGAGPYVKAEWGTRGKAGFVPMTAEAGADLAKAEETVRAAKAGKKIKSIEKPDETIEEAASKRAGFPIRAGRRAILHHGKSNEPYTVTIGQVLTDDTVRISPAGTASNKERFKRNSVPLIVPLSELSETAQSQGLRRRGQQLAGLSKAERKQVASDAREFDELIYGSSAFYDPRRYAPVEEATNPRSAAIEKGALLKKIRDEARALLGEPDTLDIDDPRERSRLLPKLKERISEFEAGEERAVSGAKIEKMKNSPEEPTNVEDLDEGDLVWRNGEWYKVDKAGGMVTKLEDGTTETYDAFDTVEIAGVVRADDPAYAGVMAEYQGQEMAQAQGVKAGTETLFPVGESRRTPVRGETKVNQVEDVLGEMKADIRAGEAERAQGKLFSIREEPPAFYSALSRAVESAPIKQAMPGDQMLNKIKGLQGVKAQEIEESGLADYLMMMKEQGKAVTKADVQAFLDQNGVKIKEVQKGGGKGSPERMFQDANQKLLPYGFEFQADMDGEYFIYSEGTIADEDEIAQAPEAARRIIQEVRDKVDFDNIGTKYHDYAPPGGVPGTYREILLTVPTTKEPTFEEWRSRYGDFYPDANETMLRKTYATVMNEARRGETPADHLYKSPHWDEPNVIAHLLTDERMVSLDDLETTDPALAAKLRAEGKTEARAFHMIEGQSDYAQRAQAEGVMPDMPLIMEKTGMGHMVQPLRDALIKRGVEVDEIAPFAIRYVSPVTGKTILAIENAPNGPDNELRLRQYDVTGKNVDDQTIKNLLNAGTMPNLPFKGDAWKRLVIRKALAEAVDGGYDLVTWSTGADRAAKWGSERVDWKRTRIAVVATETGKFRVLRDGMPVDFGIDRVVDFGTRAEAEAQASELEQTRLATGWTVSAQEQTGGTHAGQNIEALARERGVLLEQKGQTVRTKDDLRNVIKGILRDPEAGKVDKLTDRIWERMQTEPEGTSMPRKEFFEFLYDKSFVNEANEILKKMDKGAKVFMVTAGTPKNKELLKLTREDLTELRANALALEQGDMTIEDFNDAWQTDLPSDYWEGLPNPRAGSEARKHLIEMVVADVRSSRKRLAGGMSSVHAIAITDAMKASVSAGQPLYSIRETGPRADDAQLAEMPDKTSETSRKAVSRMLDLAKKIGAKVDYKIVEGKKQYINYDLPGDRAILKAHGMSDQEIDNAKRKGTRFVKAGEHELFDSRTGGRWSKVTLLPGHTAKDVYHEFAHAAEAQGALPGWRTTGPEQIAQYLEGEFEAGREINLAEFQEGGRITPGKARDQGSWSQRETWERQQARAQAAAEARQAKLGPPRQQHDLVYPTVYDEIGGRTDYEKALKQGFEHQRVDGSTVTSTFERRWDGEKMKATDDEIVILTRAGQNALENMYDRNERLDAALAAKDYDKAEQIEENEPEIDENMIPYVGPSGLWLSHDTTANEVFFKEVDKLSPELANKMLAEAFEPTMAIEEGQEPSQMPIATEQGTLFSVRPEGEASLELETGPEVSPEMRRELKKQGAAEQRERSKLKYAPLIRDLKAKIKDERLSIRDKQAALIKFAREYLPKDERGRAISAIHKIATAHRETTKQEYLRRGMEYLDALSKQIALGRETKKIIKDLNRYMEATDGKSMDPVYAEQLHDLLSDYDLKSRSKRVLERRQSLRDFVEGQKAEGRSEWELVPPELLASLKRKSVNEMTIEELRTLRDQAKMMAHIGRRYRKLKYARRQRIYEDEKDEMIATADKFTRKPKALPPKYQTPSQRKKTTAASLAEGLDNFLAVGNKVEVLAQDLDGYQFDGPNWRNIFEPTARAENDAAKLQKEYLAKNSELIKKAKEGGRTKDVFTKPVPGSEIPGIGSHTVNEIMAIYANHLNPGNYAALTVGNGYTDDDIAKLIDLLTPEQKAAAKAGMEYVQSFRKSLKEVYHDLTGLRFVEEDNYWPLHFDIEYSDFALQAQRKKDLMKEVVLKAFVERGMTKARVGGKQPVRLDFFGVMHNHVKDTIHFITHAVPVRDVQRFLTDPDIKQAIIQKQGKANYDQYTSWLKEVASPGFELGRDWLDRRIRDLQRGTVVPLLGTVLVGPRQVGSITMAMNRVGSQYVLPALARMATSPRETVKFIMEHSEYMPHRRRVFDREYREFLESREGSKFKRDLGNLSPVFLAHISFFDMLGAGPTWLGAYNKMLKDSGGDVAKASRYADHVTRTTQPASSPKDLAWVQRGPAARRALNMFYSHFANVYNQTRMEQRMFRQNMAQDETGGPASPSGKAKAVYQAMAALLLINVLPAILSGWMSRRFKLGKPKDWLKDMAGYNMAAVPFLNQIGGSIVSGYEYQGSPVVTPIRKGIDVGKALLDKDMEKAAKDTFEVSGYVFKFPSRQIMITAEGAMDLYNKKTDDYSRLLYKEYRENADYRWIRVPKKKKQTMTPDQAAALYGR